MDKIKGRVNLVSAMWSANHHAPNWLFCRGAGPLQRVKVPRQMGSGIIFILPRRRLHGRRNGRMLGRRDVAVSVRHSWNIPHELLPEVHGASGACCVSTARFFVLEPPWRNPSQIRTEASF